MYRKYIKRIADILISFIGIVVLAVPMLIFALIVKLDSKGPVLFWQKRVGLNKETFMMPKFRTMYTDTPANMPTHLLNDPAKWITRSGAIYRKLSIDELPQLWCIFIGKMSIIGPRPALWNQDDLIAERDKYGANGVRPGLTGWAQINGRDELEIPVKAALDGEYAQKLSFAFDLKCFFGTILKVISHDGVVEGGTGVTGGKKTVMVLSCHTHSLFWFRVDMMKEFIARGYDVVAVGQEPESEWADKFAAYGIKYRFLKAERNGTNPLKDLAVLRRIKKLIKEEKPDSLFCYQAKTVIYGCLAAHAEGVENIYPLIAGLGSVFIGTGFKTKLIRTVLITEYRLALRHAKAVMFQNPDDMGAFVSNKIVSEDKCRMINGSGVDTEKFIPGPLPAEAVFLCVSRLIRDKGVGEYLEAAREVKRRFPQTRFMLVGPFDTNPSAIEPEELQSYIDDGSVEYYGEQSDIRPFMSQCSVFVLPSYHEGTPKTVLEAMACGRAVITTDAPGCRETVTTGVNGVLVPIKDSVKLAKVMELFIRFPGQCTSLGLNGRKIAVEKYDVRKVNRSIMKIMNIENSEEKEYVTL